MGFISEWNAQTLGVYIVKKKVLEKHAVESALVSI